MRCLVVTIDWPNMNLMPSSCHATRMPAKKSEIMPMDCSSCTKVFSSVETYSVVRPNADVAVGDDQQIVLRLADQPHQAGDFIVDRVTAGAEQQANLALGEVGDQLLQHRQRGVVAIDAEDNLVLGIILPAEAGVILIGILVEPADRLQAT